MKKRLLSIFLVLALCLTCVPSALAVGDVRFSGGDGTVNAPYEISTAHDLFALAEAVNSGTSYQGQYFRLTNDIDLEGKAWTPIGNSASAQGQQFLGSFDGGGYHGERPVCRGNTWIRRTVRRCWKVEPDHYGRSEKPAGGGRSICREGFFLILCRRGCWVCWLWCQNHRLLLPRNRRNNSR